MMQYLLILSFFIPMKASYANQNSSCNPSSCGDIHNITFPFRLKDDPQDCGFSIYEISCENNTAASIYVYSHKYHVRAINYQNYTIRLADPTIKNNDTCSFPSYFPNWENISSYNDFPYSIFGYHNFREARPMTQIARPITFLSCPFPLNDSPFIPTDKCVSSSSNTSIIRHTYIKVGYLYAEDVRDLCTIDLVVMTPSPSIHDDQENDLSLSEIHDSLLYGFELSWSSLFCSQMCDVPGICGFDADPVWCPRFPLPCHFSYQMLNFRTEPVSIVSRNSSVKGSLGGEVIYVSCYWPWYYAALIRLLLISEMCAAYVVSVRIFIGVPFLIGILAYKFRTRHLSMFGMIEAFLQNQNMNLMPIRYSYSDITKMTKGFREKLGQGGYGSVYKGRLQSGTAVAVKALRNSSANGRDFISEVATIGRIHHVNVVELIGYCAERSKFALVYDFMSNGSLDKYIFNQENDGDPLSWDAKYEIVVGVARGIEYLHRGCDIQILHFDIKPHNILLTENFSPKISDFGLAKFYSTDKKTVTLTAARGTIGYVAPELINRSIGGVSFKADVYSFGMLLVEMLGLKQDLVANDPHKSSQYFPDWIYDRINNGMDIEARKADQTDDECRGKIKKMTIVALWCIQMSPDDRPSMSRVLEMLETEVDLLQIPPQPSELPQQVAQNEDQTWETSPTGSIALLHDDSSG